MTSLTERKHRIAAVTVAVLINSRLLDSLLVVVQVVFVAFVVVVVIATVIVEHTV